MNINLKRILTYIKITVLFMILGSAVLYFAGAPIISYVTAHGKMVIDKGGPRYQGGNLKIREPIVQDKDVLDQSEIQTPELNSQYGIITCQKIALDAPLYYGDDDIVFDNGAGQSVYSKMPGEGRPILIGGHDGTYFAPLEDIMIGDRVEISTWYGKYAYEVTKTNIVTATDTSAYDLAQDKEVLILYTCYPFNKVTGDRSKRYFVYCDRVLDSQEIQ